MQDTELLRKIVEQIENNLQLRGGRGHGHPHSHNKHGYRRYYGRSALDYEYDFFEDDPTETQTNSQPVKISKAFKGKKTNEQ